MAKIKKSSFIIEKQGDINCIEHFMASLFDLRDSINNRKLWYRGQPNSDYPLLPSVGRKHKYIGIERLLELQQETDLLHRFRRRIGAKIGKMIMPGEAIFLARHHKLPTRLLDWTANALYGLYFSCCEDIDYSGSLWSIEPFDDAVYIDVFDFAKIEKEEDLFNYRVGENDVIGHKTTDAVKIIHPFYGSERIISQDGAFTLHSNPRYPLEDYAKNKFQFRTNDLDISRLYHWNIPRDCKLPLIKQLSGLGITYRTLFPDLDGISKSLLETEVLWNRTPTP
jgi:hypothetical protein